MTCFDVLTSNAACAYLVDTRAYLFNNMAFLYIITQWGAFCLSCVAYRKLTKLHEIINMYEVFAYWFRSNFDVSHTRKQMSSKPSSSVGQNVRLINGRPQVQSLSRLVTAQLCMPRNKMQMLFKSSSSVGQNIRLINGRPQVQSLSRLVEHCRQCNFFLLCVMMSYLQSPTTYAYVQQRNVFI